MVVRFFRVINQRSKTKRRVFVFTCFRAFPESIRIGLPPPCFSFRTFSNFPCPLQSPNTISIIAGSYHHLTPDAISDRTSRTSTDSANLHRLHTLYTSSVSLFDRATREAISVESWLTKHLYLKRKTHFSNGK